MRDYIENIKLDQDLSYLELLKEMMMYPDLILHLMKYEDVIKKANYKIMKDKNKREEIIKNYEYFIEKFKKEENVILYLYDHSIAASLDVIEDEVYLFVNIYHRDDKLVRKLLQIVH